MREKYNQAGKIKLQKYKGRKEDKYKIKQSNNRQKIKIKYKMIKVERCRKQS